MAGIQWLSAFLASINGGGGGGGDTFVSSFVSHTLTGDYTIDATTIGSYAFYYNGAVPSSTPTPIDPLSITAPNATIIKDYVFQNAQNLKYLDAPLAVATDGRQAFEGCTVMEWVHIKSGMGYRMFYNCQNLKLFAYGRTDVVPGYDSNAFYNTPIRSGTGHVLVPRDQISSYESATGWSGIVEAGTQFHALEDYTVDGTVDGLLDRAKIAPLLA